MGVESEAFGSSCEPARDSLDEKEGIRRTALKRGTGGLHTLWVANAGDMTAPLVFIILYVIRCHMTGYQHLYPLLSTQLFRDAP
ncbi:hypothetical protein D3C81_2096240 [compost metagenome]